MYCNYCGALNPNDSSFCSKCGRKVPARDAINSSVPKSDEAPAAASRSSRGDQSSLDHENGYALRYAGMSADELLRLDKEKNHLREDAKRALESEIFKRGLVSEERAGAEEPANTHLQGVGGWLALLIFGMVVGSPLATLVGLSSWWSLDEEIFTRIPAFRTIMIIDIVVSLGVAGFCVFGGVALLRIHPKAVKLAKAALSAVLGYHLLVFFLPLIAGLPGPVMEEMQKAMFTELFRGIIVAMIWLSYLARSKRVRATYPVG